MGTNCIICILVFPSKKWSFHCRWQLGQMALCVRSICELGPVQFSTHTYIGRSNPPPPTLQHYCQSCQIPPNVTCYWCSSFDRLNLKKIFLRCIILITTYYCSLRVWRDPSLSQSFVYYTCENPLCTAFYLLQVQWTPLIPSPLGEGKTDGICGVTV